MKSLLLRPFSGLATAMALSALSFVGSPASASEIFLDGKAPTQRQESPAAVSDSEVGNGDGEVREWSGRIADYLNKSNYRAREKLSDLLFESIDEINFLDDTFGRVSVRGEVQRSVFDNHDVGNTYTVADTMRLDTSIPLYSKNLFTDQVKEVVHEAVKGFGISLGTSQGLELVNLRQIRSSKLRSIPSVDDVRRATLAAAEMPAVSGTEDSGEPILSPDLPGDSPALGTLAFFDPLRKARYGNFWNMFSFPVRLPLTPGSLGRLENGEIMSYSLSGTVQVGANIGWAVDVTKVFSQLAGNVGYSVYLRGDYRVTVLKEDETHARVKLTRSWTRGKNWGVNAQTDRVALFDGFVVSGQNVGAMDFYVIPFNVQADHSNKKAFDVGYRYDLTKPEARKAYQLAVLGRMAYSEQLAGGVKGSQQAQAGMDTGVEKIFTRDQRVSTEAFSVGVNYARFWKHNRSWSFSNWDAVVTLPDGTRKIVTSDTQNTREWRLFWGTSESTRYSFRVNADIERYNGGESDALYLVAEANLDDTDTSGMEMREYALEVEGALADGEVFPRLPIHGPGNPEFPEQSPPELEYGRSNFYYRMIFSQAQVERLIHYPTERMWEALEKAFGMRAGVWSTPSARFFYQVLNTPATLANAPLYLVNARFNDAPKLYHAKTIHDEWLAVRDQVTINDRARALGHLFRETVYSRELVALLRIVLEGEPVSYITSATNAAFGRVWKQGKAGVVFYPLPDRIQREVDFDQVGPRPYGDDSAQVSKIELRALSTNRHELIFGASQEPKAVYVRLYEDAQWTFGNTLGEWVVLANGKFQVGDNLVILEESAGEPWSAIAKLMKPGKQYRISMAISRDGHNWGPLNTARYFVPAYIPARRSRQ